MSTAVGSGALRPPAGAAAPAAVFVVECPRCGMPDLLGEAPARCPGCGCCAGCD
jgi:hypothetical protein